MKVNVLFLNYEYLVVDGREHLFLPSQDAEIEESDAKRLLELGTVKLFESYDVPKKSKKVGNDKKVRSSNSTSAKRSKRRRSKNVSKNRLKR